MLLSKSKNFGVTQAKQMKSGTINLKTESRKHSTINAEFGHKVLIAAPRSGGHSRV